MARILVVDDVNLVRLVIGKILKRAGHIVDEASNGEEALARVAACAPHAVITDLWMLGSDGFGLIRALQAGFPTLGVVAMSGGAPRCGQEASLDQARIAGAVQLLMKPVDKDELVIAVDQALSAYRRTVPGHGPVNGFNDAE